ncbi:winged helix-turn-helix domain-containing protein [Boseongicola aestuarii]|uniref:Aerobic respiration control protein ArcA n=1 Tax=Boseongicola aestuarii TaxID=1470561 RepID=A0A238J1A8_9RHOB|nr:helix-turn-helix domain-containing protein [Boseongicola aestuarii]SMX23684.1 Aerobic respiration control protein ArcA [Boseongicola aestuarii]
MNAAAEPSDVQFNPGFTEANRSDGSSVTFTRSEARAIAAMAASPGRLMTRNQLLDAISEPGSEKNDRNVDFLINRIRRKLGDSAKNPRFIATRYGEGYLWVGKQEPVVEDQIGDAYLIIGPVRGLGALGDMPDLAIEVANELAAQIKPLLESDQKLVIAADFAPDNAKPGEGPAVSVDLTFFRNSGKTECVLSARSLRTSRIYYATRFTLEMNTGQPGAGSAKHAKRIAPLLLAKSWHADMDSASDQLPLPVAMHEAGNKPDKGTISWPENDIRLRALRSEHPDDPAIKMMYATHLHTKYITRGRELFHQGEATCEADEAEIEALVLQSLGYVQNRPELAVVAAKLLYFVDRGYKNLALELATEALANCGSVSSSLSIFGQLRGFVGDIGAAVESLTQAKLLSTTGSHHHMYVMVMLCQVLMAAGRREELAVARSELYKQSSVLAVFLEPIFSDPINPSLRAKGVTLMLSRARAVAILRHIFYVSARLFEHQNHRENVLRTPVNLFVRRFGQGIVPADIRATVPGLFDAEPTASRRRKLHFK